MAGYVVKTHQTIKLKLIKFIISVLYPNKADIKINRNKNFVRKTKAERKHFQQPCIPRNVKISYSCRMKTTPDGILYQQKEMKSTRNCKYG